MWSGVVPEEWSVYTRGLMLHGGWRCTRHPSMYFKQSTAVHSSAQQCRGDNSRTSHSLPVSTWERYILYTVILRYDEVRFGSI